jgi:hypothetical protein
MGSVNHEKMPLQLYAIRVGNGLMKMLIMAITLDVWR